MTSQVATNRRNRSRPCSVWKSRVTLFLLVFSPEKIGDRSHHCSTEAGMPAISRVPSGRGVDSRWIRSAPSRAITWVHDGPAQKVVISNTRKPLNGSRSGLSVDGIAGRGGDAEQR